LAFGLPVDSIVKHNVRYVRVSSGGVWNMAATNGECVAISRDPDHAEFRIGYVDALSDRQDPTMKRVKAIGFEVVWEPAVASNARNEYDLLILEAKFLEG
jgi:hypothetical protein